MGFWYSCDMCGCQSLMYLGTLGNIAQYRCRACGSNVSMADNFSEMDDDLDGFNED